MQISFTYRALKQYIVCDTEGLPNNYKPILPAADTYKHMSWW